MRLKRKYILAAAGCAALALSLQAQTQPERAGHWETTFQFIATDSDDVSGENESSVEIDNTVGFGFGGAYNLSNHLALGFDFDYLSPDYSAVYNTDDSGLVSLDHELDVFTGQFSATWHFMQGPFTPFVSGSLGWTYLDSNITNGPPVGGCWWDPWWGYICDGYVDTYDDTAFSYRIGVGLRYELDNGWFLKGSLNRLQVDAKDGFDPTIDALRLELGWLLW